MKNIKSLPMHRLLAKGKNNPRCSQWLKVGKDKDTQSIE
jgi:hypothetical protein